MKRILNCNHKNTDMHSAVFATIHLFILTMSLHCWPKTIKTLQARIHHSTPSTGDHSGVFNVIQGASATFHSKFEVCKIGNSLIAGVILENEGFS